MASFRAVMKSGHPPTLFAAFLYFDFCFAIWVLNGAMGPFLTETFHLSPAQTGLMVSVPTLAGALMRFPLGVLSQYIGRKTAAMVEMSLIIVAMLYGWLFVSTFGDVMAMGVLLGIAGASFGVALVARRRVVPEGAQGPGDGHRGGGQLGHRAGLAARAAARPRLWLARGLWVRGAVHGGAAAGDAGVRQGAAGPGAPVPCASTSSACGSRTAGRST